MNSIDLKKMFAEGLKLFNSKRYEQAFKIFNNILALSPNNINKLSKIDIIDGFLIGGASQNEKKFISTDEKVFLINQLSQCGFKKIETSSL